LAGGLAGPNGDGRIVDQSEKNRMRFAGKKKVLDLDPVGRLIVASSSL
jgi:hypothetical protein